MKKKMLLCLLAFLVLPILSGCARTVKEEDVVVWEDGGVFSFTADKEKEWDGPVFGGENVEGFEGFTYLREDQVTWQPDEDELAEGKEREEVTVYMPGSESRSAREEYIVANQGSVSVGVELEPYLTWDAYKYPLEEKLNKWVQTNFSSYYAQVYRDLIITEAQPCAKGYVATVEYCDTIGWGTEYYSEFKTYYLAELDKGELVLITIDITTLDTSSETDAIVEELENYYQIDIHWDEKRAVQKYVDYAANPTENTYTTGNFLFELPMGWRPDGDLTSQIWVYAPNGDSASAGCMISIDEESIGAWKTVDLEAIIADNTEEALEKSLNAEVSDYRAEICETGLGEAAKITYVVRNTEKDAEITMYVVASDMYVYTIMAMDTADAVDSARDALDGMMENGKIQY